MLKTFLLISLIAYVVGSSVVPEDTSVIGQWKVFCSEKLYCSDGFHCCDASHCCPNHQSCCWPKSDTRCCDRSI
uniref:Cysteine rich secreted protein n=1 Tax=Riptortus pedestris TaxID=329032 RepID=R4WD11_RIPPE|nr:cysteine rich secreted protein [Riptortus pedestris]